jgi:hypothetical protein
MERSGIVTSAQKSTTVFILKIEGNGHTKPNLTKVDDGWREWTSKPRAGAKLFHSLTSAQSPVEFSTGARAGNLHVRQPPPNRRRASSTPVTLAVLAGCDPQTTL